MPGDAAEGPPQRVWLVRHGEGTHNATGRGGVLDPPLTPAGEEQAAALRGHPELQRCELLVVSPLRRAVQTAVAAFGERPRCRAVLSALCCERWASRCDEGRPKAQLLESFPFLRGWGGTEALPEQWTPTQATDADWLTRRVPAFLSWLREQPERQVVVVGHGAYFMGLLGWHMQNCEVAELVDVGALVRTLRSARPPQDRRDAAAALGRSGKAALPWTREVEGLLTDPDAAIRGNAARALGKIAEAAASGGRASRAEALAGGVARLLGDADASVRAAAAEALGDAVAAGVAAAGVAEQQDALGPIAANFAASYLAGQAALQDERAAMAAAGVAALGAAAAAAAGLQKGAGSAASEQPAAAERLPSPVVAPAPAAAPTPAAKPTLAASPSAPAETSRRPSALAGFKASIATDKPQTAEARSPRSPSPLRESEVLAARLEEKARALAAKATERPRRSSALAGFKASLDTDKPRPVEARPTPTFHKEPARFRVGQRVVLNGVHEGTVRYVGPTNFADGDWVGVELFGEDGEHDGTYLGHEYFSCPAGRGVLRHPCQITEAAVFSRIEDTLARIHARAREREAVLAQMA